MAVDCPLGRPPEPRVVPIGRDRCGLTLGRQPREPRRSSLPRHLRWRVISPGGIRSGQDDIRGLLIDRVDTGILPPRQGQLHPLRTTTCWASTTLKLPGTPPLSITGDCRPVPLAPVAASLRLRPDSFSRPAIRQSNQPVNSAPRYISGPGPGSTAPSNGLFKSPSDRYTVTLDGACHGHNSKVRRTVCQ